MNLRSVAFDVRSWHEPPTYQASTKPRVNKPIPNSTTDLVDVAAEDGPKKEWTTVPSPTWRRRKRLPTWFRVRCPIFVGEGKINALSENEASISLAIRELWMKKRYVLESRPKTTASTTMWGWRKTCTFEVEFHDGKFQVEALMVEEVEFVFSLSQPSIKRFCIDVSRKNEIALGRDAKILAVASHLIHRTEKSAEDVPTLYINRCVWYHIHQLLQLTWSPSNYETLLFCEKSYTLCPAKRKYPWVARLKERDAQIIDVDVYVPDDLLFERWWHVPSLHRLLRS